MRRAADGDAGARRAAAMLAIATCCETTAGTLSEDAGKVDLKLSFRHPHEPATQLTVHCQVKAGASFRSGARAPSITLQNIDTETIDSLRAGTQPAVLPWVPPVPSSQVYWHIVRPRGAKSRRIRIKRHQRVIPAFRYDLAIEHSLRSNTNPYGSHQLPAGSDEMLSAADERAIRVRARKAYKKLSASRPMNPLFGEIHVSRQAWRHVTRRSRSVSRRQISLSAAPYLRHFLDKTPSRIAMSSPRFVAREQRTLTARDFVLFYRNAFQLAASKYDLIVRLEERISYPTSWLSRPLGVRDIKQSATLTSWWLKKR